VFHSIIGVQRTTTAYYSARHVYEQGVLVYKKVRLRCNQENIVHMPILNTVYGQDGISDSEFWYYRHKSNERRRQLNVPPLP